MRGLVSQYELISASSVEEGIRLVQEGARPFAGGTDLMVLLDSGKLPPGKYVDILGIASLRHITITEDVVVLGALSSYADIREHSLMREEFPILVQAASETGSIAIQNRGTLGGNIANASPAADSPPGLLAYGATLLLQGYSGSRRVAYEAFHLGYKKLDLEPGELIVGVELPRLPGRLRCHYFRKIGTRKAQAISKVVVAAVGEGDSANIKSIHFAVGSVGPTVIRLRGVESLLQRAAKESEIRNEVYAAIEPLDDIRSTKDYRLAVTANAAIEFSRKLGETFA